MLPLFHQKGERRKGSLHCMLLIYMLLIGFCRSLGLVENFHREMVNLIARFIIFINDFAFQFKYGIWLQNPSFCSLGDLPLRVKYKLEFIMKL